MPLLEDFDEDFDHSVQSRGREYFRRKAAKITAADARHFEATVAGGNRYKVKVSWDEDGDPEYDCSCPFFCDRGEPCKHLWAALLQAEQDGLLVPVDEEGDPDDDADYLPPVGGLAQRMVSATGGQEPAQYPRPAGKRRGPEPSTPAPAEAADSNWKRHLARLREDLRSGSVEPPPAWPENRRILYIVDVAATVEGTGLTIELAQETIKRDGKPEKPKGLRIGREQCATMPDPDDRQIVQMLLGARRGDWGGFYGGYYEGEAPRKFVLPESAYGTTFRQMCQTGRCRLRRGPNETALEPLAWDDGEPWELWLEIRPSPGGRYYLLDGSLRRHEQQGEQRVERRIPISEPRMMLRGAGGDGGLVFQNGLVSRFNHFEAFALVISLRDGLKLSVPLDQSQELMKVLYALPRLPRLDIPDDLRMDEVRPTPKPRLTVRKPTKGLQYDDRLVAELAFDYEGRVVKASQEAHALVEKDARRVVYRDASAERAMLGRLLALGFRESFDGPYSPSARTLRLPANKLHKAVLELAAEGWHVEAEGKLYRQAGEFKLNVSSGIDWFELHGDVDFGGFKASLPKLLEALRRGERTVTLDDGSVGMLPQEWLKKYLPLAALGEQGEDHLRFTTKQVGFLDALLSSMPQATFDATFRQARDELLRFEGITPLDPPSGFTGELRHYQRDGLGWMEFLRRFGFGGCLADDMGLGKTVQVLALLEQRRQLHGSVGSDGSNGNGQSNGKARPSLVVVPRSLVFNWKQEATKFTPALKVLDHTSAQRDKDAKRFADYDVILTTYGTLRRDAGYFKDVDFDYLVLDEAQAIKNAQSESAKATRLLRGGHRLALSGTPVQNHLGELWSLFEFLNPGMMGAAAAFREAGAGVGSGESDPEARSLLAKALRPFILRRTKEQVAKELPEKTEQTLYCELEADQRKLYDELRDHYRASLLDRIAKEGLNKAKIQILEALLRLRQAACHPGLIDKGRGKEGSAKLDTLLAHLGEVLDEGHKVLVFSQFTSMLAIVRERLDAQNLPYEYLDGKTRDRQQRVERFQNDPACKLFLISLKAGGLGLNLTAAEYVFLLDPWWNPAVEAQAIDRAHRIGQTRRVFAYRLIAKDTVEEKVLQLQQSKKDLAEAIISADNNLIRTLGRDDLELLLS
jgi:superfamily II DNA or RNA helicase